MTAPNNEGTGVEPGSGTENEQRSTDFGHMERSDLEKALRAARDDAGKYRTRSKYAFNSEEEFNRAKEAVTQLDKIEQDKKSEVEKLSEKNTQLLTSAAQNELALKRYKAAMSAGIDPSQVDEFASRLQGESDEDIKADAEKLAKFFKPNGAKSGDHSQGRGNGEGEDSSNPLLAAFENL